MRPVIGERFNNLIIVERSWRNKKAGYRVKCDCGGETFATGWELKHGKIKSCGCKRMKRPGEHSAGYNDLYRRYQTVAAAKNRIFALPREEFLNLIALNCHYCGIPPGQRQRHTPRNKSLFFLYTGLDRKDNSRGYTLDNVVPCCVECNRLKLDHLSYDEMLLLSPVLKQIKKLRSLSSAA